MFFIWFSIYPWYCFIFPLFLVFQSLQVLKSSDLKPYIVFVYPPNMEKLRQMQKVFYPETNVTVRINLCFKIYEKTKSLTHSLFLASACEIRNLLLVSSYKF